MSMQSSISRSLARLGVTACITALAVTGILAAPVYAGSSTVSFNNDFGCTPSSGFTGSVSISPAVDESGLSAPNNTGLWLRLELHEVGTGGGQTPTGDFGWVWFPNGATTESYSIPTVTAVPGGNGSYIAAADGAFSGTSSAPPSGANTDAVSGDLNSQFGGSVTSEKTQPSIKCDSTTAATYSHYTMHTTGSGHILRWFSNARVLGFNVFSHGTKLNHRLIVSNTHWFTFKTTRSTTHIQVKPVYLRG
jgi:hypothetical protein